MEEQKRKGGGPEEGHVNEGQRKKDHSAGDLPKGGEEERRGNSDPTHPDLMGPFPSDAAVQGAVLGKEEQRPPQGEDAARDPRMDERQ